MNQTAVIRLVKQSAMADLTMDQVKNILALYRDQTAKTGKQLGWDYASAAFPYTIEPLPDAGEQWFYLKGTNDLYKYIVIGIEEAATAQDDSDPAPPAKEVQVILPSGCTHGDKAKANEICKFMAKKWKAELRLFNGRTIHYAHYRQ